VYDCWVHDPYFQYFTGEEFFQHQLLELLLAESLRVAHQTRVLRSQDLARVTVDTTVQPKNVTFPANAKLLHAAIKGVTV
jgi:IS5 family transposase